MTIALGLWFSFAIGVSDYHGGYLARRTRSVSTVATAFVAGTMTMAVLMLVVDGEFLGADIALGTASGMLVGFALAAMYRGISESSAAVVAPLTVTLSVVIPFGWDLSNGGSLSRLAVIGAVVAFVGLALTTFSPELGDKVRPGLVWGLIAGLCFGTAMTLLGQTTEASGLWPALVQRIVGFLALAATAMGRGFPVLVPRDWRPRAAFSGAIGATGVAAFTVGAQQGSLAEIAATTALAPVVTALLATRFEGDPMRWWQMLGAVVCACGVAMIGAG